MKRKMLIRWFTFAVAGLLFAGGVRAADPRAADLGAAGQRVADPRAADLGAAGQRVADLRAAGQRADADPRTAAPRTLVITCHTAPVNRVAFRSELNEVARQWQQWTKEGVLRSWRLLANRYVDSANWDAIAILTVGEAGLSRWADIERASPAGLTAKALALTTAVETVPADLVRESPAEARGEQPVFLVIPYEYTVPVDDYIAYLDDYVLPQTDGWIEEGVLSRYGVYLARYPAGRPWQSLLVLQYHSDRALGERDAAVAKVRARLKANPKWKAISDAKKNVRIEKQPVIADAVLAG